MGVLRILSWAIVFIFINMLCSYILVSYRYAGTNTLFHVVAVFSKVGLNFWLIPMYHHLGAAYSTLIAEGILFLLYCGFFLAMKFLPEQTFERELIEPVELRKNEQIQI